MFDIANNTEFLEAIGISNAPEETKAALISKLEDLATTKLIIALSERLTDDEADEFGRITDEKEAYDFLISHVPDFQTVAENVLRGMKNDILTRRAAIVGA